MSNIKVVLAEDHHVVRAAVATFLTKEPDIEVVGEVAEGSTLMDAVEKLRPDILILDAHMPGHKVVQSAKALRMNCPDVKILVLSAYNRREYVVGLLSAGAAGYVLKDDPPEMLVRAVRKVAAGGEWISPRVAKVLVKSVRHDDKSATTALTDREMEVMELMAHGHKNEEIAEKLVITTQTVKNHVRSIFRKLGVKTRVEAVLYAINNKLIRP
jgi:DNA-binding NarL/FixJ family response regulator